MSQVILTDEFLKHHGVKGMHWYQRRYQNPDGTLTEAGKRRYARHQAKLDTKINNAVTTGDKKKLSKLQDKMSPEQYEENYKRTVANGIQNAIIDRSKHDLRKYKEDLDPRTYKQTKKRIDFKAAVDEGDNKTIRKLSSQVKPEDIAEATQFINARLSLKESELKRIRQDTELMAQVDAITNKINTGAKFLGSVASVAKNTNAILNEYDTFTKRGSKSESDKLSSEVINKLKDDLPNMSNEELRETLKVLNSGGGSKKKDDKAKHSDFDPDEFLQHHGIKGMHWGIRRYQNPDGSLTAAGKKRQLKNYTKMMESPKGTKYISDKVVNKMRKSKNVSNYRKASDARREHFRKHDVVGDIRKETLKKYGVTEEQLQKMEDKIYLKLGTAKERKRNSELINKINNEIVTKHKEFERNDPEYSKILSDRNNSFDATVAEAKQYINNLLGEHANEKIKYHSIETIMGEKIINEVLGHYNMWRV